MPLIIWMYSASSDPISTDSTRFAVPPALGGRPSGVGIRVLPTDGEIALRGDRDAAEYLNSIGRIKYDELVADHSMTWGSPSPLQQPLERSLFHLVNLMASAARDRGINNLALPDQP